ncbi:hypothetical protein GmHk_15G043464 [Glycine max]|nr:hypothetical protein GmHk_15G043464 [Glycine max]
MEERPSEIKIKKTIDGIKEIKQMLQLLIKKKGIIKVLEGSANERIGTHCGAELGVKDKDSKTIDAGVVEEIRVEETENLQQKMQEQEGDFSIIIKEPHS